MDDDFAVRVESAAERHRGRVRLAAISGGVAALAIVTATVSGVVVLRHDATTGPASHSASATTTGTSTSAGADASPLEWARSLDLGRPTSMAYVANGALHSGDTTVALPAAEAEVIGQVDGGWLIFAGHTDSSRTPTDPSYGVLQPNGTFVELPTDAYGGDVQLQTLSPDGKSFLSGRSIIDVGERQIVGEGPADSGSSGTWTERGLVYRSASGSTEIWQPGGSAAHTVSGDFIEIGRSAAAVTLPRDGCGEVVQISDDGTTSQLFSGCQANTPRSVSPDGHLALTHGLSIISLSDAAAHSFEGLPRSLPDDNLTSVWWEDDSTMVLSVEGQPSEVDARGQATGPRSVQLVRCSTTTMSCERAGQEFTLEASDVLSLR